MFKYEKGKIVTGCVTGIEKYGVFVGLDEFILWGDYVLLAGLKPRPSIITIHFRKERVYAC